MQKIELTLKEVQKLNAEATGLLKEKLPVYIKFKLHSLKKRMVGDVESTEKLVKELFETHGYKDNGTFKIRMDSENYIMYEKELEELLKQKVEVEYEPFKFSIFENLETDTELDVFFKLLIYDNNNHEKSIPSI